MASEDLEAESSETAACLISVEVTLRGDPEKKVIAEIEVRSLSPSSRFFLAFKYLAIWWVAALFCVLIPVLHFLLVPMGIFIGLFVFARKYSLRSSMSAGAVNCPKCQTQIKIEPAAFNWPRREYCSACRSEIMMAAR